MAVISGAPGTEVGCPAGCWLSSRLPRLPIGSWPEGTPLWIATAALPVRLTPGSFLFGNNARPSGVSGRAPPTPHLPTAGPIRARPRPPSHVPHGARSGALPRRGAGRRQTGDPGGMRHVAPWTGVRGAHAAERVPAGQAWPRPRRRTSRAARRQGQEFRAEGTARAKAQRRLLTGGKGVCVPGRPSGRWRSPQPGGRTPRGRGVVTEGRSQGSCRDPRVPGLGREGARWGASCPTSSGQRRASPGLGRADTVAAEAQSYTDVTRLWGQMPWRGGA